MSTLQWLGIWAMTGFSKVERSDLDRWSKGITYLLADPKGLHYFKEFLNEPAREFGTQAQYLSVWEKCDRLVNESRISEDEANEIFNDAECLSINLGDTTQIERDIMSGEEVKVREAIIHVRDAAKDDLSTVYSAFITFTHNVKSPKKEIEEIFGGILEKDKDVSSGIAAIRTLMTVLEHDTSETVQELDSNLQAAVDAMKNTDYPVTAVASGCELFLRFITLAKLDTKTFAECKSIMLHRGQLFLKKLMEARGKVASVASGFIVDGCRVLTHSKSRVVLHAMKEAAHANKRFEVFITQSSPDNSGLEMSRLLEKEKIPCTVILDSAVGYVMEQVDMVMVGAEGVVESGGIINKVGSYTMAICAREMKKPFYVLTESFKFVRLYPLNQRDLPDEFKYISSKLGGDLSKEHPLVDYTPPSYITLLFTDLGILTPSAVSDELIKLYL